MSDKFQNFVIWWICFKVFTRKVLVFSLQVGILLRELSICDLESVYFSFKGGFVGSECLVFSAEISNLFGECGIVILQLSVSLGEVLNDDLSLQNKRIDISVLINILFYILYYKVQKNCSICATTKHHCCLLNRNNNLENIANTNQMTKHI